MDDEADRVQLVRTESRDGIRLDGAWQRPSARQGTPLDAVILLHGVGGNFYGSTLLSQLAHAILAHGLAVLRVNTRGHDGVSTAATNQGGRLQGAAYEEVADCRFDVEAWVRFLGQRGCRQITLLGHSLGAIKILYAQAKQPQSSVARLIAISPPRLAYSRFCRGHESSSFRSSLASAQHWIDDNRPQTLFQASFPFPLVISARTYLDKYGPHEQYNFLKLASELRVPINFVFGEKELASDNSAFDDIVKEIQATEWGASYSVDVVPDANHFYAGQADALATLVLRLLA